MTNYCSPYPSTGSGALFDLKHQILVDKALLGHEPHLKRMH